MGYSYNSAYVMTFDEEEPVFFTSDTHFSDERIIRLCGRPFSSASEMDSALVGLWNGIVPENGIVFHLGDFCSKEPSRWKELAGSLNGSIHLIMGNHDLRKMTPELESIFASVSDQRQIIIGKQRIYLNHYPFLCYGGAYRDIWQLFGHVHTGPGHTGLDDHRMMNLFPMQYDVGVDNNAYTPLSFSRLQEIMEERIKENAAKESLRLKEVLSRIDIGILPGKDVSEKWGSAFSAVKDGGIPAVSSRDEMYGFLCPHRKDRIITSTVHVSSSEGLIMRVQAHEVKGLRCFSVEVSDGLSSCGKFREDSNPNE